MLNVSNSLSFARLPLALLFTQDNSLIRLSAVILAMLTDVIDGYLARRNNLTSRFGAILDPLMDKFFVYFTLFILFHEQKIALWEALALLSRDFFLCLYVLFMGLYRDWRSIVLRSLRWGKVATALQFCTLISLTLGSSFAWPCYLFFVLLGWLAFLELFQTRGESSLYSK
jgi:phosphatidylglycerophosphate synthase